ncbi:MAG: type II toxin-antitoxin system VapC family toxin [Pseudonocardiaceae bacterium]
MTLVVDAGVVVAALVDDGPDGRWAESMPAIGPLAAPHLMPVEAANILRRACLAGTLSPDSAQLAHADLLRLRVVLFGYEPVAERVWGYVVRSLPMTPATSPSRKPWTPRW